MNAAEFTIKNDFPPATYEQWRALAEADLQGGAFEQKLVTHSYEGIDIQPLYTRDDQPGEADPLGFPGLPPFVRGATPLGAVRGGWDLCQEHADPDTRAANEAISEDLHGGVTSLRLRLDPAARAGWDPDDPRATALAGHDGLSVYHLNDLEALLQDVDLQAVAVTLDAGAAFLPAAGLLAAVWHRHGVAAGRARGAFNADPLTVLARDGRLPMTADVALQQLSELAAWTSQTFPHVTAVGVDTSVYHHAGASAVQDIAFGLATAVAYLRAMCSAEIPLEAAARQIVFHFSVGTHHFLSIAKLRAARQLWWRVIQAAGGPPSAGAMRLHVRTSQRVLTRRDPYVNLLRNTVGMFAAGSGGAEAITSVPFNAALGSPDAFSRRIARNTALILQHEAHLQQVVDPAGGSWFLDHLTQQVAERAWSVFQDVERHGGLLAALDSGWIANQINAAYAPRAKDIARRKEGITGVSEFPDLREPSLGPAAPDPRAVRDQAARRVAAARRDPLPIPAQAAGEPRAMAIVRAAAQGASIGQIARALGFHNQGTELQPLVARSFAEPFELLRDASDAWQAAHGRRPRVFLANLGPVSHYTARATYAKNFFEAGGFEVSGNEGYPDAESAAKALAADGASVAVICSSDKLYTELVPQAAPLLKTAGARTVVLAGNPAANEATWRAAGVDRFIFIKCDVLATLREMLTEEGVLQTADA
jgi:methylmalonyl-CoA mutase